MGRYVEALDREAALLPRIGVETLYVGGGTPTELSAVDLARLLGAVEARFGPIDRMRESTVEANCESLDDEKLGILRLAGIGRLSLGLQTPDDALLASSGRRHTWEDFRRVFEKARRLPFSLNVDLIFGLPGQTRAGFLDGLRRVLAMEPDHLSLYALHVAEKTVFHRLGIREDPDLSRAMMEDALEVLARAGYRHYEISNFARPGRESLHNINYWRNGPYLGLGCGAAGYVDGERYQNFDRIEPYLEAVESGRRPVASTERLEGKESLGETMMLGLRMTDGLPLTPALAEAFREEISRVLERGLAVLEGGCSRSLPRLRLSREGLFLASEAMREFVPPFEDRSPKESA